MKSEEFEVRGQRTEGKKVGSRRTEVGRKAEQKKNNQVWGKMGIKTVNDLEIYNTSYQLALEIFNITKSFPKEELYSLTDQIRRSSRSVPMNIREGYAKRKYQNVFIRHLIDSIGSSEETRGWLCFAKDFNYIPINKYDEIDKSYDKLNSMIYNLITNWH